MKSTSQSYRIAFYIMAVMLLLSCSSPDLSRDKATELIKQDFEKRKSDPVVTFELIEVTGVSTNGNKATATYTLKATQFQRKPVTQTASASFQRFDDGWRLISH